MLGQLGGNGGLASWMGGVITNDDIRRAVTPNAFQAARQHQMDQRVRDLRVAADGATIDAEVLGSRRSPYWQSVQLIRAPNGKLSPTGSCTCPVGFNCKHVAAVLFEYQQRAPTTVGSPTLRPWLSGATLSGPVNPETGGNPAAQPTATEAPALRGDSCLCSLDAAQEDESEDYPPTVSKRLFYVQPRPALRWHDCRRRIHRPQARRDAGQPVPAASHGPITAARAATKIPAAVRPHHPPAGEDVSRQATSSARPSWRSGLHHVCCAERKNRLRPICRPRRGSRGNRNG